MADKKIRIGVIGVGLIGKSHLKNYQKLPSAEVVAVADLNKDEADKVAKEFNVKDSYKEFKDLLKRDDIEAVDVCLHNNLHAPVSIAAMEAGKHAYCEKPMAGAFADAKAMLDSSRKTGRKLHIQLSTLYAKATKVAKVLIDQGKLGKVFHGRTTGWRRRGRPYVDGYATPAFVQKKTAGGGALYDMGVYHISAMLHLLGNPDVERISGKTYQEMDMDEERRKISGYDVEELGLGFVRFKGNVSLDIVEAWAVNLKGFDGTCVLGSKGGLTVALHGDSLVHHFSEGDSDFDAQVDVNATMGRWWNLRQNTDAYESSQGHWLAALQGRVPLLPTAELALNTMLISEGIYLSEKLGREVTADEVLKESKSTAIKV